MPATDCFLDTNILLYAISTQPAEAAKAALAQQLLATKNWVWSAQVAAEFVNASTSAKRAPALSLAAAETFITMWLSYPLVAIDGQVVKQALSIAQRYKISYFDAQIVAAAKISGCSLMYSEDLNHGQGYVGVLVQNPFRGIVP